MKTLISAGIVIAVLFGTPLGLPGGQDKPEQKAAVAQAASSAESPQPTSEMPVSKMKFQPKPSLYDPGSRRDPFRDLMGGSSAKERTANEGPDLTLDELRLIGIVKQKGKLYALVTGPQGFPYRVKEGDKFSDGYVLKITSETVTFRQTSEKGMRLITPRDIVKDLTLEER